MKKVSAIGFALLMIFAVFVPFVSANEGVSDGKGALFVQLACRSPEIGGEFTIAPVIVSAPFTDAARVDKGFVDVYVKVVGEVTTEQYTPDGVFDTRVAPGTYLLTQVDGNGGQPEFALVAVNAGEKETVTFLGHGITPADAPKAHVPVIVIKKATYGAEREVVVQEAFDETVTDAEAYDETVVDEAEHKEHKHCAGFGHTDYRDGAKHGSNFEKMFQTERTVPAVTHVVHHEAVTHVVHHDAVTETQGDFVNVKAKVQAVVDNGVTSFKFDNAQNPGGIFSTDNELQAQIDDPAYGQVKTVKIKYTVDGGATKTINAQEYQTINLV
jgi:hypothetical protein